MKAGPIIHACIPTIGLSPHLDPLVEYLRHRIDSVKLYVNSAEVPDSVAVLEAHLNVFVHHRPGKSIYAEWNEAAQRAREAKALMLVLNDDIAVPEDFEIPLRDTLVDRSQYGLISVGEGVATNGPPYGIRSVSHQRGNRREFLQWAFIARPDAWQNVDESFEIWYGDDDLIWKMIAAGWEVGVLSGLGVQHFTSSTVGRLAWVPEAAGRDGERWAAEH